MTIIERVERYSLGKMDQQEMHAFWIDMLLADDSCWDMLEMYLLLRQYFASTSGDI